MAIEIRPITTQRERRRFLTFQWQVHAGDRMWVPPVLDIHMARLNPGTGEWFGHGEAECFAAWRDGRMVGTICCAQDRARNAYHGRREAVFGYNHYLPDYAVARALWDHAAAWAAARGLDALYGPFDLDYEDAYGILLEGYDRPPTIYCGHSPPYYREFVARYGFEPAREQNIALEAPLETFADPDGPVAKLHRVARIVERRGRVSLRSADLDDWDGEVQRVVDLMNAALAVLPDHQLWSTDALESLATGIRDLIDPDLVLFGLCDGEVVGFLLGLANLNEALIRANGLRYPWDGARAWWALRRPAKCLAIKSILVLPDYWGRGVDALLLREMGMRALAKGYTWLDNSITGAENPMTPRLATRLGARVYKRWQVYRKRIDRDPI